VDWNVGIVEQWVMGKWIIVLFGIITLDMEIDNVNRLENSFEINIPLFQHSIIPCVRQKENISITYCNFRELQNFRAVKLSA